ncbi:hypothetical protein [Hyalangium sp.]|uniref:hypothetical protein n=1 Tax=Hyalangium sp. TaxID=2028555 RepID=UPI002D305A87|nr:hypothetical protein [Hyalangium sp.]HYH99586.1 hypothetical protein [Hyalangium sp.]
MSAVEAILAPADALRARLYRLLAPWAGPLFADRARRVAWLGATQVVIAFLLTLAAPLWMLALGPVLLGVPHLVSDARYLVVRPGLHRRTVLALLCGAPLLATCLGAGPAIGLLALLPAILGAQGPWSRKGLMLTVWACLSGLALGFGATFQLAFAHLHNVIAVALWWWAWRERHARAWAVPLLAAAGTVALLLGTAEPVLTALGAWTAPWTGASFTQHAEALAPRAPPVLALRLVLAFAFLQSVHYSVWLRLIPEDDRPRAAPRPWRATWRALVEDFGGVPLTLFVALAFGIAVWGVVDLTQARLGYLRLAVFHGYLELAVGALWLIEGRRS